jgi:hypothetical protein
LDLISFTLESVAQRGNGGSEMVARSLHATAMEKKIVALLGKVPSQSRTIEEWSKGRTRQIRNPLDTPLNESTMTFVLQHE